MGRKNESFSKKIRETNRIASRKSKKKKSALLGESYDAASYKLRKMLLVSMAVVLELDICHRCKQTIENIDDFSIDHMIQWAETDNPKKYFYDLKNIVFSHASCNYRNDGKTKFHVRENKSGLRGITFLKKVKGKKWRAQIKRDRKTYSLGCFDTKEEAAKAYDSKATEFWGEDAITNEKLNLINY